MGRYLIFFTFFYQDDLAMLCIDLAFITQYSNIPLCSFFTPSCLTFVNTNGRPDMLIRKVMNEKFI